MLRMMTGDARAVGQGWIEGRTAVHTLRAAVVPVFARRSRGSHMHTMRTHLLAHLRTYKSRGAPMSVSQIAELKADRWIDEVRA